MTQRKSQVNPSTGSGQGLLSIHEFAQVCRTTPRTLRFYEQKGLFKPAKIDVNNKYRSYAPKQARDFLKIRLLQNFHIPLKNIRIYSSSEVRHLTDESRSSRQARTIRPGVTAEGYLENRLQSIKEEIREKEKEYKFLGKIKAFLFQNNRDYGQARMTSRQSILQTKSFGPFHLFCMKVEHGEYAKITDYIKTLWEEAKRLKLECKPSEITFYLNNAYSPKNTPLEIALIVKRHSGKRPKETDPESVLFRVESRDSGVALLPRMTGKNFYFKTYPKTKVLTYDYNGPYEYLILIYQKLFEYIKNQNIELKGLVFETYKYGTLNTKSKYDYQTTIGFSV